MVKSCAQLLTAPSDDFLLPVLLITLLPVIKVFSIPSTYIIGWMSFMSVTLFIFSMPLGLFTSLLHCVTASWQILSVSVSQMEPSVRLALRNSRKFCSVRRRGQDNPVEIWTCSSRCFRDFVSLHPSPPGVTSVCHVTRTGEISETDCSVLQKKLRGKPVSLKRVPSNKRYLHRGTPAPT